MKLHLLIFLSFLLSISIFGQTATSTPNPSERLQIIVQPSTPPAVPRAVDTFRNAIEWGEPVDGLQMAVSVSGYPVSAKTTLNIALQNAGETDLTVNLGIMLANGKVQLPQNLSVNLLDSEGRVHEFRFLDMKYSLVAGRVDDYIIPLRSGSIYILKLRFDQFYSTDDKRSLADISNGYYRLTVGLKGTSAEFLNLDTPGLKLMNFWLGSVESNKVRIDK